MFISIDRLHTLKMYVGVKGIMFTFSPEVTTKMDKIHKTMVSRHWSTGSTGLYLPRERNEVSHAISPALCWSH